jgi:PPK2 family polyphosphate:nucleotide phosphotransferase
MAVDQVLLDRIAGWIDPYRVTDGSRFRLKRVKPEDTGGLTGEDKDDARERLADGVAWLAKEQEKLYAQDRRSLLIIFQAMDAAGKDSTIKHVMSGVNPQGCVVHSFKRPSSEELDHDWLWRCWRRLPERGHIGIFNRSYYEEVLVVRVHDHILQSQKLPKACVTPRIFSQRLADIAAFEDYLTRNGTTVVKFFLHVSRGEQKKRFLSRLDEPAKHWKFEPADIKERRYWDDYMSAYEEAIRATASEHSPWFVVPADNKWFTRVVVAGAIVETLEKMNLSFPKVEPARLAELAKARKKLLKDAD